MKRIILAWVCLTCNVNVSGGSGREQFMRGADKIAALPKFTSLVGSDTTVGRQRPKLAMDAAEPVECVMDVQNQDKIAPVE